ncbi:MAG: bifunctional glycosyltransferase family 2/GtrA family protein [Actinobacteria bacterium]|nr:bifunctional glycosyltransferase family 2/GtrA family protein [Actinomycetota bacterium]
MTATLTETIDIAQPDPPAPVLDVVVPVHDEERDLGPSVRRVHQHLTEHFPYSFRITIADNASTDRTPAVAAALVTELDHVRVVRLEQKGRGRALRTVWSESDAAVLAYMDVDLSTDLSALLPLVAPLISGHSHLAIGTRLARGSTVVRGAKREVISRCYNLILRGTLAARFSDAQCGFKAIRSDVAAELLPLVEDTGWFFDTELLVLAQRSGLRVHEVPVDWVDDPDSRVDIVATAMADLRGVARLTRGFVSGSIPVGKVRARFADQNVAFASQLWRFVQIGVASTAAYALAFVLLRQAMSAQLANVVALLLTAIANTAANRRLTFGIRDSSGAVKQHAQALLVFALGLGLTAGSLAVVHATTPSASHTIELTVLLVANLVTTISRFLVLRLWVFAHHRAAPVFPETQVTAS